MAAELRGLAEDLAVPAAVAEPTSPTSPVPCHERTCFPRAAAALLVLLFIVTVRFNKDDFPTELQVTQEEPSAGLPLPGAWGPGGPPILSPAPAVASITEKGLAASTAAALTQRPAPQVAPAWAVSANATAARSRSATIAPAPTAPAVTAAATQTAVKEAAVKGARCLRFLHIPKTGGSSIERQMWFLNNGRDAKKRFPAWGMHDEHIQCTRPIKDKNTWRINCVMPGPGSVVCNHYHVPPSGDPVTLRSYEGCELFCVVRDPLSRFASEWKYSLERTGKDACDARNFTWFANKALGRARRNPYDADCHLTPQARFVFAGRGKDRRQVCKHVLRFERLKQDFDALMKSWDIPMQLTEHALQTPLCKLHVDKQLRRRIWEMYQEDYEAFGYT